MNESGTDGEICPFFINSQFGFVLRKTKLNLTDWFGIPKAREEYISDSKEKPFSVPLMINAPVGFLYLRIFIFADYI